MKRRLTNKQKDYITLSTILAFFALVTYVMIVIINCVVKAVVPIIF